MEVDPKNSSMFTFIWSIYNFRHCAPSGHLKSPEFGVEFLKDCKFYLEFKPKGRNPGFSSIYLCQEKQSDPNPTFFFNVRVFKRHEDFKTPKENEMNVFVAPICGCERFYHIQCLNSLMAIYGTLTVYCCILKKDTDIPMTVQCSGDTEIKATNLRYMWVLKDILSSDNLFFSSIINRTAKIPNFSSEIPDIEIWFYVKPNSDDKFIHFAIKSLVRIQTFYLMYDVALLDSNKSKAHSVNGQHLFEKSVAKQVVKFAFLSMRKLLLDKQLYLHNGELTLQCEFTICTNDVENHIESIEYGSMKDLHFEYKEELKPFPRETDYWDQNTLQLYEEGKFSDFIIRSASRDFLVHKAILAAQSEVFSDAFEQDMKDQNTGVFEIKDLDNDTISKMLLFIYRNKLGVIDYHYYLKLFSAADRYKIAELRKRCLDSLQYMSFEDASDVCDVLALADTHQEQKLKTLAQEHILENPSKIIDSEAWKKLMDSHPRLTSETMQKIICKKILKRP